MASYQMPDTTPRVWASASCWHLRPSLTVPGSPVHQAVPVHLAVSVRPWTCPSHDSSQVPQQARGATTTSVSRWWVGGDVTRSWRVGCGHGHACASRDASWIRRNA